MGLCAQTGDPNLFSTTLVLLLILLASIHVGANDQPQQGRKRHYYIAAVDIDWNYQGNETHRFLPTYKKVVFREYEKDFTKEKIHPPWLGILGPTLRGEEGDIIVVTFRNMATQPCSLHPHGIAYGKQSEGAHYFDNTSQREKEDDVVKPNSEHVYTWEVTPEVSPKPDDPTCLTYSYISHQNVVEDFNAGLVGTLLVCKRGSLDETGMQSGVNQELVFLFGVFDERQSIHKPSYIYDDNTSNRHVHYTINGYTKGALPGLSMCAYSSVSLHLLGMSSEPELFSVHMNGQVLQHMGHKVSSLGLISGSSATASMVPVHTGRWMLSSHVLKHIEVGMHAFVDVKKCEAFKAPRREITRQQRHDSREWKYYIAAEEVFWDYAPEMPDHIDESYKSQYLQQSSTRIGGKYKKAVYTLYNNESFTERIESKQKKSELGILGPVIRAQIRDVITVVFKNMASRPYSIYPHGLTIEKSEEGVNYPEGGNHSHAVQPGETHTYVWRVVEEDEPLKRDPRCLTRLYHSAVDTPRDIASGLIGPLLICKSQSLNVRNVQVKADKEQQAMFAVFDENKSWYLDDNIRGFCDPSQVNKADPGFYKSNVMHTINGYVYESGPLLGFCNGDVAKWHVSSVGAQDYIQTATAYGHTFELNKRKEDILSLFPMTGETITMNMENIGVWLLATLNSHETTKGMRIKFQDVECFRDHYYEYDYDEPEKKFDLLKPPSLDEIKKKEEEKEKQRLKPSNTVETDLDTEMFANELGLRSLKKQLKDSVESIEKLDLSFLDYDAVDVFNKNVRQATSVTKSTKATIDYSPSLDNKTKTNQTALYNTTASLNYGNRSTEATNLPLDVKANLQAGRLNVTLTGGNEDAEEQLTRGDVFAFSEARSPSIPDTQSNHSSLNTISQDIRSLDIQNRAVFGAVLKDSESTVNEDGPQMDSYKFLIIPADFIPENVTVNSTQSNSSGNTTFETFLKQSNSTSSSFNNSQNSGNFSLAGRLQSSLEELDGSESSEEVFIYLKQNHTEVIKSNSVKTKSHNWTYDGTHQNVPMQIPDHIMKYVQKQTTPAPKRTPKIRRVIFRQKPQKGFGIKTRRKKEYNPLVTNGLPLSPRGFNPNMIPRGSRPVSLQAVPEEEDLMNKPVVIGVPRPDFSDYELYVPGDEPDHLALEDLKADEYDYVNYKDPYSSHLDIQNIDDFKQSGPNVKMYFISAEEVEWDYSGSGLKRQERPQLSNRHTKFKKVVFRGYMDGLFRIPEIRGEKEEHLGILGPVIKAEYGQSIMVVFRNNANRPFSLHPNGVSYTKSTEGLSYEDASTASYKGDNEVLPNTTFTYIWKVPRKADHTQDEPHCRTWTYYSGVNPEKDIHSGLIGPLLVCPKGTLNNMTDISEFTLLFMTFDESQSWYYETNREIMQRKSRRRFQDPNVKEDLKFHSINGITHNLKGLRMYTKQLVRWHLINMGSPTDFQSIHFHGQTFLHQQATSNRHGVFPLLPGSFATLEMYPSKPGLWQLETEIGVNQQRGMQTLFLVLDNDCYRPLGLESGSVKDGQITANITRGYWEPHLARLNNQGKYNAWSTDQNNSFIQVDFQRPVVISQVATQGAKQLFQSQFVTNYSISYSNDHKRWSLYKGDSRYPMKVFPGNQEAYETKTNTFFPPVIARFIRLHPLQWYNTATVRMEYYGCELDGCSVPLGMENGLIEDYRITASSTSSSWYLGAWLPSYARLNKQGTVNAWQAKYKDMKQWLQVELPEVKKITGIITQGAKSLGKEMYVTFYSLQHSEDGIYWNDYNEDEDRPPKIFRGNNKNNEHVKNFIYPPIFSRFIRIIPRNWKGSITMRVELLGCDFE
ncbi:coagulation factor V isoform X2 [Dunckerocampus dactyliophorus]|uniref:coagulation factor V isoform X2 n=1 Tax=Dunckerocampus dactyliophorus TaxID=161453 RepID=UPI002404E39F|nr:coagulation factor V isoform X2 [Dunckerocampus dactyliophorus]